MNARDFLFIALGLAALLAGGYYLYTQQPTQQVILFPTLEWDFPVNANVNDALTVRLAVAHFEQQTVFLDVDGNRFTQACVSDPCTLDFPLQFSRPGLYALKVHLGKSNSTRTISIKDTQTRCIDGTPESDCASPPMQCVNGSLIPRCSACGCPAGAVCENDACVIPVLKLSIPLLQVNAASSTTLRATFTLRNDSAVTASGLFLLQLDIYDNAEQRLLSTPQQVRLEDISPGGTQQVQVESLSPLRSARIGGKIFSMTPSGGIGELLGETTTTQPLTVTTDSIPPAPPSNVHSSSSNGQASLEWVASPSTDVIGYTIYRENFDSEQFTTYSLLAEVTHSPYAVPSASTTLHYIVRAKDAAGNLSTPSDAIAISGGNST